MRAGQYLSPLKIACDLEKLSINNLIFEIKIIVESRKIMSFTSLKNESSQKQFKKIKIRWKLVNLLYF